MSLTCIIVDVSVKLPKRVSNLIFSDGHLYILVWQFPSWEAVPRHNPYNAADGRTQDAVSAAPPAALRAETRAQKSPKASLERRE
jgi:hypothetical protein